jgi:Protein of unknown function (DUF2911)
MKANKIYFFFILLAFGCTHNKNETANNITADSVRTQNAYVKPDQSELDISWWPANYPIQKMQSDTIAKLKARVIYSRPHKNGRTIFGEAEDNLCKYGKPWRLGANEATEITFFTDVIIDNKKINKGAYVIYCIPFKDKWEIKLNTNLFTWGLHIDATKDIFSTTIKTTTQEPAIENFTMVFEEIKNGANLIMAWDNVKAILPISIAN